MHEPRKFPPARKSTTTNPALNFSTVYHKNIMQIIVLPKNSPNNENEASEKHGRN